MKALLFAVLVAASSSAAVAQETVEFDDHFVSRFTRAEVIKEVERAGARGEMVTQGEITVFADGQGGTMRAAAEVRSEGHDAARTCAADAGRAASLRPFARLGASCSGLAATQRHARQSEADAEQRDRAG